MDTIHTGNKSHQMSKDDVYHPSYNDDVASPKRRNNAKPLKEFFFNYRNGEVAFRGLATSPENLLERAINKYKGQAEFRKNAFKNLILNNLDFHTLDVSGLDFSGSSFRNVKIRSLKCNGTYFTKCKIKDSQISMFGKRTRLHEIEATRSDFSGSEMEDSDFSFFSGLNCKWWNAKLTHPRMEYATFNKCSFNTSYITVPVLYESSFFMTDFRNASILCEEDEQKFAVEKTGGDAPKALPWSIPLPDTSVNSSFIGCSYDNATFSHKFRSIHRDYTTSKISNYLATGMAALCAGYGIEKAMDLIHPQLESFVNHNHGLYFGICVMSGVTIFSELAGEKLKDSVQGCLSRVWTAARECVAGIARRGVEIKDIVVSMGTDRSMEPLHMALMAERARTNKSTTMGIFSDIVKSTLNGDNIQIIACENKNMVKALESLTRFYHDRGCKKHDINIVNSSSDFFDKGVPYSITLGKDGYLTAIWADNKKIGSFETSMIVRYSPEGEVVEAIGGNKENLEMRDIEKLEIDNGRKILRRFIEKVVSHDYFKARDVRFDLNMSYVSASDMEKPSFLSMFNKNSGPGFAIRSARNDRIDNRFGPAVYGQGMSSRAYYLNGELKTKIEGEEAVSGRFKSPGIVQANSVDGRFTLPPEEDRSAKDTAVKDAVENSVIDESSNDIRDSYVPAVPNRIARDNPSERDISSEESVQSGYIPKGTRTPRTPILCPSLDKSCDKIPSDKSGANKSGSVRKAPEITPAVKEYASGPDRKPGAKPGAGPLM